MTTKPSCFGKFSKDSQFCVEVCKFANECGGHVQDAQLQAKMLYKRGDITFKEMLQERMKIIEYEVNQKRLR